MKHSKPGFVFLILLVSTVVIALISTFYGAVEISFSEMASCFQKLLFTGETLNLNENIFLELRLPRVILCLGVGGILALGGTLMQALFRNPIVEPGLVGTSSGAAFGAAFFLVLGATYHLNSNSYSLPIAAFLGAILSTFMVFFLAQTKHGSSIVTILLVGVAVNALFLSGIGIFAYIARDPQARSITFWSLGTLSGANWESAILVAVVFIVGLLFSLRLSKELNALMLGEEEASYIGVNVNRLKIKTLLVNVLMVATATAFVGVISFIGLIIPHLLRLILGSNNRFLIINSALLGGLFLCLADLLARTLFSPAELPIGIVTSFVGVPVFIYLLRSKNYFFK
ncbi:MAG: iron ABC transporter permease [Crocinitomicaceae bacterium]|nr:iron ABC transporter permease [Crocinitomicaceae bacterium]